MHLDEGTIHAWLDGALDAEEAARVERHAAECGPCAAAIAEARGLVAGASRILTALDGVPGNVVPKTGVSVGGSRSRRTRSLWATLHLTPARAAAAAIVVMAAGTALVLRNAPNAARSAIKLADNPNPAATMQPAAPMVVPHVAPDTAASRTFSAPAREAPRASRRAGVGQGGEGRAAGVTVAPKAAQPVHADEVAVSDSARRERMTDSLATKKELAVARNAVADNAARGAAATATASPAPAAPPSAVAQRLGAAKLSPVARSAAGCYAVTTDSAIALPPRLWLDSSVVPQPAMLRSRAAAADAAAPERRGVSVIANDARRSIAGAYWTPRSDGSIRLLLPASSVNVDLFPASASTLVGAMPLGERSATVTLRRVECGSR